MAVHTTIANRITWRELQQYLPQGTRLTSCLRSSEDQLKFIEEKARAHGYHFKKAPKVDDPSTWREAHQFVRNKGYKVAAPGKSAHQQGVAYDLSGADLEAIKAGVEDAVRNKRLTLVSGSPSALLIEPQNNCVHVEIAQIVLYNDFSVFERV
jgi:hypothetical protein